MGGVEQPAWAGGKITYDCQLKAYGSPSEHSFIPKTQRLTIDRDAGTAMVWDDIIELLIGKPVAVGVVEMGTSGSTSAGLCTTCPRQERQSFMSATRRACSCRRTG